jgi:hypothetical protein
MDDRFRSILALALHPGTGEGEAAAALNRARAMAAKQGLDALLGAASQSQTRVETRERVVYRSPNHTHTRRASYRILPRWRYSFLERLFLDASHYGCTVEMVSCDGETNSTDSRMVLVVNILGTVDGLNRFDTEIDHWFAQMNGQRTETQRQQEPPRNTSPPPHKKEQSWWARLRDFF